MAYRPNTVHSLCKQYLQSVQFSCSVMSDSLQPHGLQHTKPPYPSATPGVYTNSCPLNRWCHPSISSSGIPFSSSIQTFSASVQFNSFAQSCPTLCDPMDCSTSALPVHHQLPDITQLRSIELVMPSNHLILCHPFSSCLQSFPASGYFPMSQCFTSGGQSIGVSASASVLPMNIQDRFPSGWTGLISLQSKGLSRVFSNTTV